MPHYYIPAEALTNEESIKNSQFITQVEPVATVEAAKSFIKKIKQKTPDASHHCWAYIVGDPNSTTLIGCSDDGEPSGTAGKPMLHVLQHSDLGDIVVVCSRYFGGTKLGTGGLARAYGGGTKLVIEQLAVKQKIDYLPLSFECDYHQLQDCQHVLKQYQTEQLQIDYQTKILLSVNIAADQKASLQTALINQLKGQIEWIITSS